MNTTRKKLSELHKTPINIRMHSERQIKEYIRSLKMFGQIRPLVVTDDGEILVGNGMYDALLSMGENECDVYIVSGLTKSQKKKLMLADNKVYELGVTDVSALDMILPELDFDFDVPGYDSELLATLTSSLTDVNNMINSYGKEELTFSENRQDNVVTYENANGSQYAPPVRTDSGEIVSAGQVAQTEGQERKYIICPNCGEKIWL